MLRRVLVHNFKSLVNFELRLDNLTLLLGPNGSGKSAVLDVLYALRRLLAGEAKITDRDVFPPSTLTRWQAFRNQVFELDVEAGGEIYRYRLEIEHDEGGKLSRIANESLDAVEHRFIGAHGFAKFISKPGTTLDEVSAEQSALFSCELGQVQLYRDNGSEGPKYQVDWSESALARVPAGRDNTRLTRFKSAVQAVIVSAVLPSSIHPESTDEHSLLSRDAANFVDWYRHALQEDPASAGRYINALRPLIEGLQNIRLQESGLDTRALMIELTHKASSQRHFSLRFDELSDGQRTLVVLYALLHFRRPGGDTVFCLDEPENFVALAEIQPWLMEVVELCEDTASQALICSHHPELIDYLGPDRGVMLRRAAAGATIAEPISSLEVDGSLKLSEQIARGWVG